MGVIRGNSYYQLVEGPTWTAASSNAQSIGGTLAIIEDANENKFITEYLGDQNVYNSAFIDSKEAGGWMESRFLSTTSIQTSSPTKTGISPDTHTQKSGLQAQKRLSNHGK